MKLLTLTVLYINLHLIYSSVIWRKVFVDDEIVNEVNDRVLRSSLSLPVTRVKHISVQQCYTYEWCWLVCLNDNGTYTFSDMQISPLYRNTSKGLSCYTKLKPDLAFGKVITSNQEQTESRKAIFLTDGVNTRGVNQCFQGKLGKPGQRSWFQIDLGAMYEISSVFLTSNHGMYRGDVQDTFRAREIVVRISDHDDNGHFDDYTFFAYYKGPANPGETFEMKGTGKVRGRFVGVEKTLKTDELFLMCHVQIF
ncbi:UNVERIFIED_CONTAM: hypothetical protein RMT77_015535 [Armadillidium vulgare]